MIGLVKQFGFSPIVAFRIVAFIGALLYAYALLRFSRRFQVRTTRFFATVAGIFTGSVPVFAGLAEYYALAQALMALSLVLTLEDIENERLPWRGFLAALLGAAFHFKIVVVLARRKMSLTELSEKVGVTIANLSILKQNHARAVRFSTLDAICKILDCQPGDILEYRDSV